MNALLLASVIFVQQPGTVDLGVRCEGENCIISAAVLRSLVDSHNAMLDEIRILRRLVRDADTICRAERRL